MPNIGEFHPIIIHFAIVLLILGVLFRIAALSRKLAFTGPVAAFLILAGTLAAALAVQSGSDAHGPAERVPGARDAVVEHEEWGERARNIFMVVAALELLGLWLARSGRARPAYVLSAVVGLGGAFAIYEAAEHGGELVYSYAGGVGVRTGEPEDVGRLLLAGLYHQSQLDRREGRLEDAAELVEQMARRFPSDQSVQLLAVESRLRDREDAAGALDQLSQLRGDPEDRRFQLRSGMLRAEIQQALGDKAGARQTLEGLLTDFPNNQRILNLIKEIGEP